MLVTQFDKFVNRSTQQILGSAIERENLVPMLSSSIPAKLQNLKVTENGIYYPETGYDGFYEVDVNIPTNTGIHYILNPAWSRKVMASLGDGRIFQLAPFIAYVRGSTSYNYKVQNITVDGISTPCIRRNPAYYDGYIAFAEQVPADAHKLFIQIQYEEASGNYRRVGKLLICSDFEDNIIKTIHFVNSDMTPEAINSQTGVTINSTNNKSLAMQVVEIDISDLNYAIYLRFNDSAACPILAGIWYII